MGAGEAQRTALVIGMACAVVASALLAALPGEALAARIVVAALAVAAWVAAVARRWMVTVALLGVVVQAWLVQPDGVIVALCAALAGALALGAVESLHLRRTWRGPIERSWVIERQHVLGAVRRVLAGAAIGIIGALVVAVPAAPRMVAAAGGLIGMALVVWTIARPGDSARDRRAA